MGLVTTLAVLSRSYLRTTDGPCPKSPCAVEHLELHVRPHPHRPCGVAWTLFLSAAMTAAPIGSRCVRVDRDLINETSARQRCPNAKTPLRCLNTKTPLRWPAGAAHTPPLRLPRLCVLRLYRPFPGGLFVVVAQRPRIAQLWECTVSEFLREFVYGPSCPV